MYNLKKHCCRFTQPIPRRTKFSVTASDQGGPSSPGRTVIIECDGGLLDVHNEGHRVAFNKAFEELGYGCAQWSTSIYFDILRMGDATGPGLVKTYYEITGWPIMLSTSDRPAFMEKVYATKQKCFRQMVDTGEIPLRDGVLEFIDDVLADGIRPIILAGTSSAPEDSVVSCAMMNLGPSRAFKMQVLYLGAPADVAGSLMDPSSVGNDEENVDLTSNLELRMAQAQAQAKKVAATSFTRAVNLQSSWGTGMRVDPALIAGKERAILASPSFLAAVLTTLQCSAAESVMVASSHSIMEAGKGVGMFVAGVPASRGKRGGFSAADGSFDGFGAGGGLTWRKAKTMLESKNKKK
jgi:beta-phosphoglucomutase-like phosphatase (HAD superfamily)